MLCRCTANGLVLIPLKHVAESGVIRAGGRNRTGSVSAATLSMARSNSIQSVSNHGIAAFCGMALPLLPLPRTCSRMTPIVDGLAPAGLVTQQVATGQVAARVLRRPSHERGTNADFGHNHGHERRLHGPEERGGILVTFYVSSSI